MEILFTKHLFQWLTSTHIFYTLISAYTLIYVDYSRTLIESTLSRSGGAFIPKSCGMIVKKRFEASRNCSRDPFLSISSWSSLRTLYAFDIWSIEILPRGNFCRSISNSFICWLSRFTSKIRQMSSWTGRGSFESEFVASICKSHAQKDKHYPSLLSCLKYLSAFLQVRLHHWFWISA